jgi:hypothetical protein
MRQLLRPWPDAPHCSVPIRTGRVADASPTVRAVSVLPLAMTAVFVWGVILPLEIAVQLLGSS